MSTKVRATTFLLALVGIAFSPACEKGTSPAASEPSPVSITLVPASLQVQPMGVIPFTATVTGSADGGIVWSVQGGASNGTITGSGVYTAPATDGQYVVVASSAADSSKIGTATVTVKALSPIGVAIMVSPKAPTVALRGSVPFTAVVTGTDTIGVTWSIPGGPANGTVTVDGLYTAPDRVGTYDVVVTSVADPSRSDVAVVTVAAPPPLGEGSSLAVQLATLSLQAIYFAHASVGENILDGVMDLTAGNPGSEPTVMNQGGASPATVSGALRPGVLLGNGWGIPNGDLAAKVAIFDRTMRGGVGAVARIAMMKPCYSDFPGRLTPRQAFDAYVAAIDGLQALYPGVTFVHFTSPLSSVNPGNVNSYRHAYSNLIRAKYGTVGPLFDIAEVESTDPDGRQVLVDGVPAMYPGYTSDGGHLNAMGRGVVARALVAQLATLP